MEETGRYILQVCQTYQNPDFYHWAIALKEKEQAIGFLQAEIEKNTDCARLSFGLGRHCLLYTSCHGDFERIP